MSKGDDLNKGLGKILSTAALAGSMALAQSGIKNEKVNDVSPKIQRPTFSATELKPESDFDKNALQQAMARVESNEGRNINHEMLSAGQDAGTRAKGHYGFTNSTIKDVIRSSPNLRASQADVLDFDDEQMHNLIYNDQPHLQHHLASQQIDNISRMLHTKRPEHVAHAWLHGVGGTAKALKEGQDINNHWHVKKVMDAYNDIIGKKAGLNKKEKTPPGTYAKFTPEKSKEISQTIQSILSEQWRKAKENLNSDDEFEPSKPDPLDEWNLFMDDLENNDANVFIINLIKNKII